MFTSPDYVATADSLAEHAAHPEAWCWYGHYGRYQAYAEYM